MRVENWHGTACGTIVGWSSDRDVLYAIVQWNEESFPVRVGAISLVYKREILQGVVDEYYVMRF